MQKARFKFRYEEECKRIVKALNETFFIFTVTSPTEVWIWGEATIGNVEEACIDHKLQYEKEIV